MGLTSFEDAIKEQLKERKNAHFMLVDGMSKLLTEKVNNFQSLDFQVSGLKWRLLIQPAVGVKDYLSVAVWIIDEKFSVGCHNEKQPAQGVVKFITHTQLKERFLVNDKAVFYAEISEEVIPNFLVTGIPRTMGTAERFKLIEVARNNSRFTWKITKFSSFNGEEHSSYEFTVGPRRWKLVMYPRGTGDGKGNSLSLYLNASNYVTNNGPKGRTFAVYKLRVLDQLHRNHFEIDCQDWFLYDPVHPRLCSWGRTKFLPLEELHKAYRGFLVNDQIYIGVEFLIVSTTEYL
ncbi:unnamed protein product [Arabidopsis thaliana]|uniref:(thale cress) hypothetical protein n=1 Tax=Arabidopsis thaliana TaxID=3702 RepID=A0A7G2EDW6_ARATH|nr:unnamed protein product [Arabidopsis thaliana]